MKNLLNHSANSVVIIFLFMLANVFVSHAETNSEIDKYRIQKKNNLSVTASGISTSFVKNDRLILDHNGSTWDTIGMDFYTYINLTTLSEELNKIYVGSLFVNDTKVLLSYDLAGNVISRITQNWNSVSSSWDNNQKKEEAFDSEGNKTLSLNMNWNSVSSSWDTVSGFSAQYTYNGSNILTEAHFMDYISGAFVNSDKIIYTVNASNEWSEVLYQSWNTTLSAWEDDARNTNITWYDFLRRAASSYEIQTYQAPLWVNWARYTLAYDGNGNLLTNLAEWWNTGAWQNLSLSTNTYDASDRILSTTNQQWSGGAFENDSRETFSYDSFGNILQYTNDYWSGTSWDISYGERHAFSYDAFNNILSDEMENYSWQTSMWALNKKYIYTWNNLTAFAPVESTIPGEVLIFPNPASDVLNIQFNSELKSASLEIYSISGQMILAGFDIGESKVNVDISNLPPGIYLARIYGEMISRTYKFVVL